jgi:polyhydroxyalkanoate synthesis regulator phasin
MESRCLENVSSLLASYQSTKEEYDQKIEAAESLSSNVDDKLSNLENRATKLTDTLHLNKESIDSLNKERVALSSRIDLIASSNASSLDEKDAKIIELSENLEVYQSKIQESASIISNFVTYSSKVKECASSLANIERPSSPARFMGKPETVNLENINEDLLVLKELVSTHEVNFDEAKIMVQDARTEVQSLVEGYRTKLSHMKNMISAKVKTFTGHYQSELRTVYSQNTALSERCNNLEAQLFQKEYSAEEETIMSKKAMMHSQEMIQYLLSKFLYISNFKR